MFICTNQSCISFDKSNVTQENLLAAGIDVGDADIILDFIEKAKKRDSKTSKKEPGV